MVGFNRFCHEKPRVCLNQHEFEHVDLLITDPNRVEPLQVSGHFLHNVLDGHFLAVFNDALVDAPYYFLNHLEAIEKLASRIEHLLRKNILFSIYPQVREAFLRRV